MLKAQDIDAFNRLTQQGKFPEAFDYIETLLTRNPAHAGLLFMAARLAEKLGKIEPAVQHYTALLTQADTKPDDLFNIALRLKALGAFDKALGAYEQCLGLGIDQPEDVYVNMGVIYADFLFETQKGEQCFQKALELNPQLVAAAINLGNLFEETGRLGKAVAIYEGAYERVPEAYELMARQANAQTISDPSNPLIRKLLDASENPRASSFDKECLFFALGNAYDTLRDYKQAFNSYQSANTNGKVHGKPYDRGAMEAHVSEIIRTYSPNNLATKTGHDFDTGDHASPIFICGMFRSGSTLIEQVISSHSDITAKGELDFFSRLKTPNYTLGHAFAQDILAPQTVRNLRNSYLSQPGMSLLATPYFTDKRPDNFLHIGLIKTLFPDSKIIHTVRNPLDTSLSIFFTQFGDSQAYARDLDDIVHFYKQHDRLLAHWRTCFTDDIFTVSYDDFVKENEPISREIIAFLELDWDPACLDFHKRTNRVKTASFKQVRRNLYQSSSGRWENYAAYIPNLINQFK